VSRGLLRCGAAAGPLFIGVFTIEGARRPDYRPLRHPVSSLSLGGRGWVQAANFAATGMLYLAGAAGLARSADPRGNRLGAAVLGATGVGLLGSAAFRMDPVGGYPPWRSRRSGGRYWPVYSAATVLSMRARRQPC
jgi:hypothetical protein